jgi:hypothetical protein
MHTTLTAPLTGFAYLPELGVYAPVIAHAIVATDDGLRFVVTANLGGTHVAALAGDEIDDAETAAEDCATYADDARYDPARRALRP